MTSKASARTRRTCWAVAVCLWMSVTLAGCSGGDEEAPWPWQDEEPPAPAADFAGMWDLDPTKPFPDEEGAGFLFIEEPCVYMVEDINEPHDPLRRVVVRLPEDYTRYDPQTQSIWVWTQGPSTHRRQSLHRRKLHRCPQWGTLDDMPGQRPIHSQEHELTRRTASGLVLTQTRPAGGSTSNPKAADHVGSQLANDTSVFEIIDNL